MSIINGSLTISLLELNGDENIARKNILQRLLNDQNERSTPSRQCPIRFIKRIGSDAFEKRVKEGEVVVSKLGDALWREWSQKNDEFQKMYKSKHGRNRSYEERARAQLAEDVQNLDEGYGRDTATLLTWLPDVEKYYQWPEARFLVLKTVVGLTHEMERNDSNASTSSNTERAPEEPIRQNNKKRRLEFDQLQQKPMLPGEEDGNTVGFVECETHHTRDGSNSIEHISPESDQLRDATQHASSAQVHTSAETEGANLVFESVGLGQGGTIGSKPNRTDANSNEGNVAASQNVITGNNLTNKRSTDQQAFLSNEQDGGNAHFTGYEPNNDDQQLHRVQAHQGNDVSTLGQSTLLTVPNSLHNSVPVNCTASGIPSNVLQLIPYTTKDGIYAPLTYHSLAGLEDSVDLIITYQWHAYGCYECCTPQAWEGDGAWLSNGSVNLSALPKELLQIIRNSDNYQRWERGEQYIPCVRAFVPNSPEQSSPYCLLKCIVLRSALLPHT